MNSMKELRKSRGLGQKEVAAMIGVTQPTVSDGRIKKKTPPGSGFKRSANYSVYQGKRFSALNR